MKGYYDDKIKHLSQGSVWSNKHGHLYTVLAVTNISIHETEHSERQREVFPLCVVFLNSENDIFSCDAERFLRMYEYEENNNQVDECMNNVYRANIGELDIEDEEEDEISIVDSEESENDEDGQIEEEIAKLEVEPKKTEVSLAEQMVKSELPFEFFTDVADPIISPEDLTSALCGYSEYVDFGGTHFHKFLFNANSAVNIDSLTTAFSHEYSKAVISSVLCGSVELTWNVFCNATVEFHNATQQLVVIVALEHEFDNATTEEEKIEEKVDQNDEDTLSNEENEELKQRLIESAEGDLPTEAPVEVVECIEQIDNTTTSSDDIQDAVIVSENKTEVAQEASDDMPEDVLGDVAEEVSRFIELRNAKTE